MTDDQLRAWDNDLSDINDDLHQHFESWGRWDWCDIVEEARRVQSVMFGLEVEEYSAQSAITSAAVAHADQAAYEVMAAALGVDSLDLRCTLAMWSENQDNLPAPVTPAKLMKMVNATKIEFADRQNKYEER